MDEKRIHLRAFESDDVKDLHRWTNDPVSLATVGRLPQTYEQMVKQVEKKRQNGDLLLAAVNNENELIGWVFLKDIDYEHGRAGIGILLAPEARGKGYGGIVMQKMLEIGFKRLRLHKIYLTTRGFNEQAISLYKKLGFVVEGTLRQHAYVDGQYFDTYFMGLLESEWRQN
ncbi:GNAT family N-acetyltransferase [Paenibacillus turpanensis]|uniref:GNAT family N-acetyltransferase n=1 Tax=Paenibacillus turpanensis TaxID=2689078 RepID=UPI00140AAF58|nr:GNAT family protein [Paenibacillus turpanensis]